MVSGVEPFRLQEQSNTAFLGCCLAKVRVNYWLPYFCPVVLANEIKRTSDRNFIRTIDLARWRRSWSVENPVNSSEKNSLIMPNEIGLISNRLFTQNLIAVRSSSGVEAKRSSLPFGTAEMFQRVLDADSLTTSLAKYSVRKVKG